jgi:hypothetical protein
VVVLSGALDTVALCDGSAGAATDKECTCRQKSSQKKKMGGRLN